MIELAGFLEAATKMAELHVQQYEIARKSLEKAAIVIERKAKSKIGTYQEQVGQFIAWPELAESTKVDRVAKGFNEDDPGLRTGEMRDSIGHTVGDGEAQVGSNDDKLVFFELGTSKQPPRSVLAGAAIECRERIVQIIGENAVMGLVGKEVFNERIELDDA